MNGFDWSGALATKYGILSRQASADMLRSQAAQTSAGADVTRADAAAQGTANTYDVSLRELGQMEPVRKAQAELVKAQAEALERLGKPVGISGGFGIDALPRFASKEDSPIDVPTAESYLTQPRPIRTIRSRPYGYAKGTARVPGKGDPRVDSVPAKLAPGEAVLNKPAADMAGRGLIAALNSMGARKMGMV